MVFISPWPAIGNSHYFTLEPTALQGFIEGNFFGLESSKRVIITLANYMIRIVKSERTHSKEMSVGRINIGPEGSEIGNDYLYCAARLNYAINLFHNTEYIVKMLKGVIEINMVNRSIPERVGEYVQIMNDVRARTSIEVDSNCAGALFFPQPKSRINGVGTIVRKPADPKS